MNLGNTLSTSTSSHRPIQQLRIRVADGPDAGREAVSDGRELSIGTAPGNQLVLTDPTVSRHHLAVRCTERGYWVRDLGSTNGILMGPHLVQSAVVSDGCELEIGTTRLTFELLDDEISQPDAAATWNTMRCDPGPTVGNDTADVDLADAPRGHAVVVDEFDPTLSFRDAKERAIDCWERWYVGELLRHTRGNLSEAARVAHSDRSHLRKLVRKHLRGGSGPVDSSESVDADGSVDGGD
jgi:hypothetical protein